MEPDIDIIRTTYIGTDHWQYPIYEFTMILKDSLYPHRVQMYRINKYPHEERPWRIEQRIGTWRGIIKLEKSKHSHVYDFHREKYKNGVCNNTALLKETSLLPEIHSMILALLGGMFDVIW